MARWLQAWRGALAGLSILGVAAIAGQPLSDDERKERIIELYAPVRTQFPDLPHLSVAQLLAEMESRQWVIVDVRPEAERKVSTLPGAVSSTQIEADPQRYQGQKLVAYCTLGVRSAKWAQHMRDQGLDVHNLAGSLLAWTHEGGPLVDASGAPTRRVHTYSASWDFTPEAYEGVVP